MEKTAQITMNIEQIFDILPQRYPFLFVDKVIDIQEISPGQRLGRKLKAIKNVTIMENFFQGHFPHRKVMPGVLILEAMAQAGALACFRPEDPRMDIAVAKFEETRFRQPVVPGDTLLLEAEVLKDRGRIIRVGCAAFVEGKMVAETKILASVHPIDSLDKNN